MSCKLSGANYRAYEAPGQFQGTRIKPVDQTIRQCELGIKDAERPPMPMDVLLPPQPAAKPGEDPCHNLTDLFRLHQKENRIMFRRGSMTRRPGDAVEEY